MNKKKNLGQCYNVDDPNYWKQEKYKEKKKVLIKTKKEKHERQEEKRKLNREQTEKKKQITTTLYPNYLIKKEIKLLNKTNEKGI